MKQFLVLMALTLSAAFSTAATFSCGAPRTNVTARISATYLADNGEVLCFATEVGTKNHYRVTDCGYLRVGSVIKGNVWTHWTHKDAAGYPVCDFQTFEPRF